MIKCPSCNGEKFEHHIISGLLMAEDKIVPSALETDRKYYTCVECEYVIAQPSDLNLTTVNVYVLGESLSKQRQGLKHLLDEGLLSPAPDQIKTDEQSIRLFGYFEISGNWVFTKPAWKTYEATPDFPLAEGQHKTEVKVLY